MEEENIFHQKILAAVGDHRCLQEGVAVRPAVSAALCSLKEGENKKHPGLGKRSKSSRFGVALTLHMYIHIYVCIHTMIYISYGLEGFGGL